MLETPATVYGTDYMEFSTDGAVLSLYAVKAMEELAPGAVREGGTGGAMIMEFRVEDVDREYRRLQAHDIAWVKPPTTQPWGNRSIYLRDPDGNLVHLYSRVEGT